MTAWGRALLDKLVKLDNLSLEPAGVLSQSVGLVRKMSMELRTISYLLHPPSLDELGLLTALRTLVDGFSQRSGIGASLQIDDTLGGLPCEVEISIYRVAQECLTNIHRHSSSPTARIPVERLPAQIHVEIQDHGGGMTTEKITKGFGVGLAGMRECAIQLGGTQKIKSNRKSKTVIVRLPYRID
jgi:two-component system, NarL family, sensor kinase